MAKADEDRKRSRAAAREAYRRQYEERRAKRLNTTVKVQPFDPAKFVDTVRIQSWATIHTVAYAALLTAALIFIGRAAGSQAAGGFAALLAIGSIYYYLLRVWGLDIREIKRVSAIVGIYLTYFVTWLMVSFLVTNPPIIDDAPPEIHDLTAFVQAADGNWTRTNLTAVNASNNDTARIVFHVVDNSPLARVTFGYSDPFGAAVPAVDLAPDAKGDYTFTFTNLTCVLGRSYLFTIEAWDARGQYTAQHAAISIDDGPNSC